MSHNTIKHFQKTQIMESRSGYRSGSTGKPTENTDKNGIPWELYSLRNIAVFIYLWELQSTMA